MQESEIAQLDPHTYPLPLVGFAQYRKKIKSIAEPQCIDHWSTVISV